MVCSCWFTLAVGAVIAFLVIRFIWEFFSVSNLEKKAVFITGCDTGFGRALAQKCAKRGMPVFAGCLTDKGASSLKEECSLPNLHTVPCDVTKDDSVQAAVKYVKENLPTGAVLWAVVNNAGIFSCYGPDDWLSIDDYKLSLEVNTLGVIRVTQAFMKMIKDSCGRVVTVTSVNGRLSSPAAGPYVVAKFGAEAYMDALRQEMFGFGVKCSILEPGVFRTPLIDEQAMIDRVNKVWSRLDDETKADYGEKYKDYFAKMWNKTYTGMSSSNINYVVDNYYHAITAVYPRARYRFGYYCGWDSKFVFVPLSLMPAWFSDRFIRSLGKQEVLPSRVEEKLKSQ